MAEFVGVKVTGLKELIAALHVSAVAMPDDVGSVNRKAAAALVPAARSLTPQRTGRLAGSVRAGASQRKGVIRAGSASVPYAAVIHWGWPRHHIASNPFLTNAVRENVDTIRGLYVDELQSLLDRRF